MKLFEAVITSNYDLSKTGRLSVSSTSFPGIRYAHYTSPYGSYHNPLDGEKSGFFGIPCIGQLVLIAQTEDEENFYFLAAIHKPDWVNDPNPVLSVIDKAPIPSEVYSHFEGVPQKVVLRDPYGNRLTLSHSYAPEPNREANMVELRSGIGKRLALIDSPMLDRIVLETDQYDGIRIASNAPNPARDLGPNQMVLRTKGIMQHFADMGIDITVVDGTELNISNDSTSFNTTSGVNYGNVNVTSAKKDINLTAKGPSSKIMLRSKGSGGVVQINSDGSIIIKAPSDNIYIEADNINLKATTDLNIEAGGNINVKAGNQAVMSGSAATLALAEDADLDGGFVNLAPVGGVTPAGGAESAAEITNDYGD